MTSLDPHYDISYWIQKLREAYGDDTVRAACNRFEATYIDPPETATELRRWAIEQAVALNRHTMWTTATITQDADHLITYVTQPTYTGDSPQMPPIRSDAPTPYGDGRPTSSGIPHPYSYVGSPIIGSPDDVCVICGQPENSWLHLTEDTNG